MRTFRTSDDENHLYFMIEKLEGEQIFLEVEKKLRAEPDIALLERETTIYLLAMKGVWKELDFELTFDMDYGNTSLYSESPECLAHLEEILNDE